MTLKTPRDLQKTLRTLQKLDKKVLDIYAQLDKLACAYVPFEWEMRPHTRLVCQLLHAELAADIQALQELALTGPDVYTA